MRKWFLKAKLKILTAGLNIPRIMVSVNISTMNVSTACKQVSKPGELCFIAHKCALKSKNDSYSSGYISNHSNKHSGHSVNADGHPPVFRLHNA